MPVPRGLIVGMRPTSYAARCERTSWPSASSPTIAMRVAGTPRMLSPIATLRPEPPTTRSVPWSSTSSSMRASPITVTRAGAAGCERIVVGLSVGMRVGSRAQVRDRGIHDLARGCRHVERDSGLIGAQRLEGVELRLQQLRRHVLVGAPVHPARDELEGAEQVHEHRPRCLAAQQIPIGAPQGRADHDDPELPFLVKQLADGAQPWFTVGVVERYARRHLRDVLGRVQPVAVHRPAADALGEQFGDRRLPRALNPHDHDRGIRDRVRHPFVAPAVRPETMYFCVNSAITMMGIVTTTAAAMRPPQSMLAYPTKSKIATGRVFVLAPESTSANMKLFHEKMNDRMLAVAIPGTDSGSVIFRNAPIGVRPSTCACSSRSSGSESKNDIMM